MTSTGWRTGRREACCATCGVAFTPGSSVVSTLVAAESDAQAPFERRDYCTACFDAAASRPFSWWRAAVPQPDDKKAAFDLGVAREFLLRLLQEDAPERASLRYLLTLLLLRKRIVRVADQFRDERGDVMTVRIPPDDTVHEVPCPDIDEAEAAALREQLGRLFDLGDGAPTAD